MSGNSVVITDFCRPFMKSTRELLTSLMAIATLTGALYWYDAQTGNEAGPIDVDLPQAP